MKNYIILFLLMVMNWSYAQEINQYKYALIPSKFEFLREADLYQVNSLTQFLMEKEGFTAFLDTDEMPEEMMLSNCNKIYVDVLSNGNFLATKLTVVLKDCKGKVLFTSTEGRSKQKDYKKAYHEALRLAFNSFNTLHYAYQPSSVKAVTAAVVKEPVVVAPVVVASVATTTVAKSVPVETVKVAETEVPVKTFNETLFAQPIENGYQLIDKTPKVIMKIYNTSVKDVYSARVGDKQGVFLSKDNQWFFEYYQDDKLISEKINVKF